MASSSAAASAACPVERGFLSTGISSGLADPVLDCNQLLRREVLGIHQPKYQLLG